MFESAVFLSKLSWCSAMNFLSDKRMVIKKENRTDLRNCLVFLSKHEKFSRRLNKTFCENFRLQVISSRTYCNQ